LTKLKSFVPRGHHVGEFVLVVLGVLVALMVDSWIADRQDVQLRSEYLSRLADDLETDLQNFDYRIEFFTGVESFGLKTLDRLRSEEEQGVDAVIGAFYAAENYEFDIIDNTYNDLQNTGNIRLLSDIELRMSLASYHSRATAQNNELLDDEYRRIVRGIIPWRIQNLIRINCPTTAVSDSRPTGFPPCSLAGVSDAEARAVFEKIKSYPRIFEILTYRVSQVGVVVWLFSGQRRAASDLLSELENVR